MDSIVVLDRNDIPIAQAISRNLATYSTFVFDPCLVDALDESGLMNIHFVPWDNSPPYHKLDQASRKEAFRIERAIEDGVRPILGHAPVISWQHLNFYYLILRTDWYRMMWQDMAPLFNGGAVHIPLPNSPSRYFFNSFIPAIFLMLELERRGTPYTGYLYGPSLENPPMIPDLSGVQNDGHDGYLLTHLPTIIYDLPTFNSALTGHGHPVLNIECDVWNNPIRAHANTPLIDCEQVLISLPRPQQEAVESAYEMVLHITQEILENRIPVEPYRTKQAALFARLYRGQFIFYFSLMQAFDRRKISKILLSDHDAGLHGPIISFAESNSLPVILLPHSKYTCDVEYCYTGITSLSHPTQSRHIFNRNLQRVLNFPVLYPQTVTCPTSLRKIKTVSLLLNGLSLSGVYFSRYTTYFDGIKRIAAWSTEYDLKLKIRCKPCYGIMSILSKELGYPIDELRRYGEEPLDNHIDDIDVCIMYDTPTTAMLSYLAKGIPVLNPVIEPLAPMENWLGNSGLVPQDSVEAILGQIDGFLSDQGSLYSLTVGQFAKYVDMLAKARPLGAYL